MRDQITAWIYATQASMAAVIWGLAGLLGRWIWNRIGRP